MKNRIFLLVFFVICSQFAFSQNLHLYGGESHDVYLGCLTCDKYDSNSIWNEYGQYGNKYGIYGSEYNTLSPWNKYSSTSPVVVDKEGNFYGYFTVNEFSTKRADFKLAKLIYKYYDLIPDNVSGWYDKISEN